MRVIAIFLSIEPLEMCFVHVNPNEVKICLVLELHVAVQLYAPEVLQTLGSNLIFRL